MVQSGSWKRRYETEKDGYRPGERIEAPKEALSAQESWKRSYDTEKDRYGPGERMEAPNETRSAQEKPNVCDSQAKMSVQEWRLQLRRHRH